MLGIFLGLSFCVASHAAAENADIKAGERAFRMHCRSCHAVGEKAVSRDHGPALNGVTEQKSARAKDFEFSGAMQKSGLIWTEKNFVAYLLDPQRVLAGSSKKMPVIKDEKKLKAVYRYLQQF
ncbi:cytochrome c-550 [Betaproteobacteria bacterium]|nr:cytochrome c-550 [Betaproteobacteria bacterium]